MSQAQLEFTSNSPFDEEERSTLETLWSLVRQSQHANKDVFLDTMQAHVTRTGGVAEALVAYPPIFREQELGRRRRDVATLVDLLAQATDANFEMYLPTRALVGRALLMAEMNAWRLMSLVCEETVEEYESGDEAHPVRAEVDRWLHGCVHTKLTEEVLGSISMDAVMEPAIRTEAVRSLAHLWENRLSYRVQNFFPLLEATWNARRSIRVSVGTLLGVSEIFRLLQAGCDPEFVDYFSRPRLTRDEQEAFQEFLIGVSTEKIFNLEQLMEKSGKTSLSPTEAADLMTTPMIDPDEEQSHPGVRAYEFYRARYLQAAARRLKNLPGPKKTAEEYVMIYFLDQETRN